MGSEGTRKRGKKAKDAILDDFRAEGNGLAEYVLKNFYVYFWRWATWKVFESIPGDRAGVVCFITTSGYIGGPGFKGMREYLRRTCSEGWVIDVSPEGIRPHVPTRLFPGVQRPLAIGIFVRAADINEASPAKIKYLAIDGMRAEKFKSLAELNIESSGWREARDAWQAPLTPAAGSDWDNYAALVDLMPWVAPGVKPNRTWVYAPSRNVLTDRWATLVGEKDIKTKRLLFKETADTSLDKVKKPLPIIKVNASTGPFKSETGEAPPPIRVGYRTFDRQWLIPDSRLIHRPSPDLWSACIPSQLFALEQHAHTFAGGPGMVFSALIPDMDYFNNRGGRVLPLLHPDGSANLAPGLTDALSESLGHKTSPEDLIAYLAGVVAHPAFTEHFADELTTPGIRVPITTDPHLWREEIKLGREVIWLHTYGEAFAADEDDRPPGNVRFPKGDPRQPFSLKPITKMPTEKTYNADTQTLRLGDGEWARSDQRSSATR